MWLFTPFGYFSVVAHRDDKRLLLVRARVAEDLTALRKKYLPSLSKTKRTPLADYAARATVTRRAFAKAVAKIALDIDYDNFKSEVGKKQGGERAHVYLNVWTATRALQYPKPSHPMIFPPEQYTAYTGKVKGDKTASGPYAGLPLAWRDD